MQENETNPQEPSQVNQETPIVVLSPYAERLKKAFEGKEDLRLVVRAIKPYFPEVRTADLSLAVSFIQDGIMQDEDILKAVESL